MASVICMCCKEFLYEDARIPFTSHGLCKCCKLKLIAEDEKRGLYIMSKKGDEKGGGS